MMYNEKNRYGFICSVKFILAIVFIFVLSAYSNTIYSPFVLDDYHSFVTEPKVLGFSFTNRAIIELLRTKFGFYRFIPMLTFALDLHWGNGSIIAFHVTNILIHIFASAALFFFLKQLFDLTGNAANSHFYSWRNNSVLIVCFITGLWSLCPVHTNAVTYIVQRMTSLAGLFYFLALGMYCYGRNIQLHNGLRIKFLSFYLLSFLSGLSALLCKQNSATIPIIILLIEIICCKNDNFISFIKAHKKSATICMFAISAFVYFKIASGMLDGYANRHFNLMERLLTELRVVGSYLFLLLLPLPGFLTLEHDVPVSTGLFSPFSTFLSLLFLVSIIVVSWKFRKKEPLVTLGVYWFFVNLLLESSIFPLELKFEHRLYVPSVGFYVALVLMLNVICKKIFHGEYGVNAIKIFVAGGIIILSSFSLMTYVRNISWQDPITLYRDCVKKAPHKARVHSNLGRFLANDGQFEEAIKESEIALELGKDGYEEYWVSANNVIAALSALGKQEVAIDRAQTFIDSAPTNAKRNAYPIFLLRLGKIYFQEGEYELAIDVFWKGLVFARRCDLPVSVNLEKNLVAVMHAALENDDFGLKSGLEVDRDVPVSVAVKEIVAEKFFQIGDYVKARLYCETCPGSFLKSEACEKIVENIGKIELANQRQREKGTIRDNYLYHPLESKFHFCMALAYASLKLGVNSKKLLLPMFGAARKMAPDNADLYLLRSWLFYKNENYSTAMADIEKAIVCDPDYARAWINKGIYLMAEKKYAAALSAFSMGMRMYPDYPHKDELEIMISYAEKHLDKEDNLLGKKTLSMTIMVGVWS